MRYGAVEGIFPSMQSLQKGVSDYTKGESGKLISAGIVIAAAAVLIMIMKRKKRRKK